MFCFPYAAGRPQAFRSWPNGLPARCELIAVCYPARGARLHDPPLASAQELAREVAQAIRSQSELPFVLFGHSMGALIAFEVARELRHTNGPAPARLLVSAQAAPHLPLAAPQSAALGDEALLERLETIGGTPPEVLQSEEFVQLLLPALRADFRVCDSYTYEPQEPLETPIETFAAIDDHEVSIVEVNAWQEQTTATCSNHLLAGDHFFVHTAEQAILQAVTQSLPSSHATRHDPFEAVT